MPLDLPLQRRRYAVFSNQNQDGGSGNKCRYSLQKAGTGMKKTVDNFQPAGGMHCITNAMKQIFNFYGHPLSEEMLFGLGEGLDFAYINMAHSPMVSGRSKIMEFEGILSKRLGVGMKFRKGRDNNKSFEAARKMIDGNQPVLIYADMPYLPYMSLDPDSHFGGHAVVLFGYDDEQGCFYVSDRDNPDFPVRTPGGMIAENYHMVSYEQMELARSSAFRPFPANNKYIMLEAAELLENSRIRTIGSRFFEIAEEWDIVARTVGGG